MILTCVSINKSEIRGIPFFSTMLCALYYVLCVCCIRMTLIPTSRHIYLGRSIFYNTSRRHNEWRNWAIILWSFRRIIHTVIRLLNKKYLQVKMRSFHLVCGFINSWELGKCSNACSLFLHPFYSIHSQFYSTCSVQLLFRYSINKHTHFTVNISTRYNHILFMLSRD